MAVTDPQQLIHLSVTDQALTTAQLTSACRLTRALKTSLAVSHKYVLSWQKKSKNITGRDKT